MKMLIIICSVLLLVGCAGVDPKVGQKFENSIKYDDKYLKIPYNYDVVLVWADSYEKHSDYDIITFKIDETNVTSPRHRSFKSRVASMPVELEFELLLLDMNRVCFDKVVAFKNAYTMPSTLRLKVPHNERLKYVALLVGVRWYVRH